MDLRLITPPASEPVALFDAQSHLRAGIDGDDAALISAYLQAAREQVEAYTNRALMPQTWELRLREFPKGCYRGVYLGADRMPIDLPRAPLASVTSVNYLPAGGGAEVLLAGSAYQVEAPSGPWAGPGRLYPAAGTDWPATLKEASGAVRIRFVAGYASAHVVPAMLRAAILLFLGELYEHREASAMRKIEDVPAVSRLLSPFRIMAL